MSVKTVCVQKITKTVCGKLTKNPGFSTSNSAERSADYKVTFFVHAIRLPIFVQIDPVCAVICAKCQKSYRREAYSFSPIMQNYI